MCTRIADAAYVASRARAQPLTAALWPGGEQAAGPGAPMADLHVRAAQLQLRLVAWPELAADEVWATAQTPKALACPLAQAAFRALWARGDAGHRANLQAQTAPGAAAWLQLPPHPGRRPSPTASSQPRWGTGWGPCWKGGAWGMQVLHPAPGPAGGPRPVMHRGGGETACTGTTASETSYTNSPEGHA